MSPVYHDDHPGSNPTLLYSDSRSLKRKKMPKAAVGSIVKIRNLRANDDQSVRLGKAYCDITDSNNDIGEDICVAHDSYAIVTDHWSRPWSSGLPVVVVSCEDGVGWLYEDEYITVKTT